MTLKSYKDKMSKMSSKDYNNELLNQIYVSANVSSKKHENLNDAIIMFFTGIVFLFLAFTQILL